MKYQYVFEKHKDNNQQTVTEKNKIRYAHAHLTMLQCHYQRQRVLKCDFLTEGSSLKNNKGFNHG